MSSDGKSNIYDRLHPRISTIIIVLLSCLIIFVGIALFSYDAADPGYSHYNSWAVVRNMEGYVGAWTADILIFIFGVVAFALPVLITGLVIELIQGKSKDDFLTPVVRCCGCIILVIATCSLASMHYPYQHKGVIDSGGVIGQNISWHLLGLMSNVGATLWSSTAWVIGAELFFARSPTLMVARLVKLMFLQFLTCLAYCGRTLVYSLKRPDYKQPVALKRSEYSKVASKKNKIASMSEQQDIGQQSLAIKPARQPSSMQYKNWVDIPIGLLKDPDSSNNFEYSSAQIHALSELIEQRLQEFAVEVRVVGACPGPVVTRFELDLAPGTKVSKISALAKDIARSLSVSSVRIVEVISGKSVIGLEIPNKNRIIVRIKPILSSTQFNQGNMNLPLALGSGIDGEAVVADLAKMPHLLVAGTTGSGKSVAVNAMLTSLLYRLTPADCKLILIDPKMLELSVYEGIPHLLTPVITDMSLAAQSLAWAVGEMERRYALMSAFGVRNIASFNRKILEAQASGSPLCDPRPQVEGDGPVELDKFPYIVIIVDEFADMIMAIGKSVEQLIARIAQKARAAGIHLILATQRPSVDVITGLIKANIPARIAFQIPTKTDSRIILDQGGAEALLGQGDMLYLPPGTALPIRVHGAFIEDAEVHAVVKALRAKGSPNYLPDIENYNVDAIGGSSKNSYDGSAEVQDELYDSVVAWVIESRKASISAVQRQFKIGYNRAANIVEALEQAGIVSDGRSGPRKVLVDNNAN